VIDDLERQLKDALGRKEPPAWFEAKVLGAAARQKSERRSWLQRIMHGGRLRFATAVAAVGLVASGVIWQQHERRAEADRERMAGEAAKARLMLALKTTRVKLEKIQQRVAAIERVD